MQSNCTEGQGIERGPTLSGLRTAKRKTPRSARDTGISYTQISDHDAVAVVRFEASFGAGGPFWAFVFAPVVRFGIPFWCRWCVLDSILVLVVRFGVSFWCRWFVLGLHFGGGASVWGSILVPVHFGFWYAVVRFGAPFWCQWFVLGVYFGAGGPFWGSILVPVVRFGAPF